LAEHERPTDVDEHDRATAALDVRIAVGRLPWAQRVVLVLRYLDDLPEAEVARLLGCSVGTVKSRASRALSALRSSDLLSPESSKPPPRGCQ
jgi:RNA polymerase sigma factor (sigma-70 family)